MTGQEHTALREEIIISLNAKYPAMRKLFGIKKIGIFGSIARGEERPLSDIDIEVEFEPSLDTFKNYIGLVFYLEDLFGRPVDLVTTRVLAGYLRPDVRAAGAAINRNKAYLNLILDEMAFLLQRAKTMTYKDFARDEVMKRAVSRSLEVIGESARNMSAEFKDSRPGIPWRELEGMRYRLIHAYFGIDTIMVWSGIEMEIPVWEPKLRDLIKTI